MKSINIEKCAKNIIFLTGGVCSGIGKGVALSSLSAMLKAKGYKVRVKKFDPYLNVDPGTMSPYQHGEVFVTADGVETDLDIGNYERFSGQKSSQSDYITSGKVYWEILNKERQGDYGGHTVQLMPHVTDHIQESFLKDTEDIDFLLCEIGGTAGDLEGMAVYESMRQLSMKINSMFIHVTYLPYIETAGEIKTKPVQHSVRTLLSMGIKPDVIICRGSFSKTDDQWKDKIALFTDLDSENVILGSDVQNTYDMLCMYKESGLFEQVSKFFDIKADYDDSFEKFNNFAKTIKQTSDEVTIALVGKYVALEDAYKSIKEALLYAGVNNHVNVKIHWVDAEKIYEDDEKAWKQVMDSDGIIIPGGFGIRGSEGMMKVIRYARTKDIPLLGICLGMQLIAIEFARNVCGLESSGSTEFGEYEHKIIDLMDNLLELDNRYKLVSKITGCMRLGEYRSLIKNDSRLANIYEGDHFNERFRHRYETNKEFLDIFAENGLEVVAAHNQDSDKYEFSKIIKMKNTFIDAMEIKDKKFYVGVQCHPEFTAKPLNGHKLFNSFIKAVKQEIK